MTVHLIKLCVGCDSVEDLREWQRERLTELKRARRKPILEHHTRMMPRRRQEILDGGSLYWVIKGLVRVRQRIVGLDPRADVDGQAFCAIRYTPEMVLTVPRSHRPFQGWRYLEAADAPPDLGPVDALREGEAPPSEMLDELRSLGLI
jgi:hypothetical protein